MADDDLKVTITAGGQTVETTTGAMGDPGVRDEIADALREMFGDGAVVEEPEERRYVRFAMAGEDARALLARLILFTDAGKGAPIQARHLYLSVGERWIVGGALNGISFAVQKMRCEAVDASGALVLDVEDAAAILSMIPKPGGENDPPLSDVDFDFICGGDPKHGRPVNVTYIEGGRVRSYSTQNSPVRGPSFEDQFGRSISSGYRSVARLAVDPRLMALVEKASRVARDQVPYGVRWHIAGEREQRHGEPLPGSIVASFSVAPTHDLFAAVLLPLHTKWEDRHSLSGIQSSLFELDSEPERLRPVMGSVLS